MLAELAVSGMVAKGKAWGFVLLLTPAMSLQESVKTCRVGFLR
jgi:hypothetical protein